MYYLFILLVWFPFVGHAVEVLYLSCRYDPSSHMMIHWHAGKEPSGIEYRLEGEEWEWRDSVPVLLHPGKVCVHTVALMDLEPGREYEFRLEEEVYRFKTLPMTLEQPVRFVVGGDAYFNLGRFRRMNRVIAEQNPAFVVVGGDIAYTYGALGWLKNGSWPLKRWQTFFKEWKKTMVTDEGCLIPMIPVIGNHDVRGASLDKEYSHTLFYDLFAFPQQGIAFYEVPVGNYLNLFILDSGHSCHVKGMQTKWLRKALAEKENIPYKIAAYHVGAYPTVYPYSGKTPQDIREAWSVLFERYHLSVAFEHHNHAYKRTFPIKQEKIDPDGVVYMGDGSWGVHARKTKDLWYLAEKAGVNAVCLVTLSKEQALVEALRIDGEKIDEVSIFPTAGTSLKEGQSSPGRYSLVK